MLLGRLARHEHARRRSAKASGTYVARRFAATASYERLSSRLSPRAAPRSPASRCPDRRSSRPLKGLVTPQRGFDALDALPHPGRRSTSPSTTTSDVVRACRAELLAPVPRTPASTRTGRASPGCRRTPSSARGPAAQREQDGNREHRRQDGAPHDARARSRVQKRPSGQCPPRPSARARGCGSALIPSPISLEQRRQKGQRREHGDHADEDRSDRQAAENRVRDEHIPNIASTKATPLNTTARLAVAPRSRRSPPASRGRAPAPRDSARRRTASSRSRARGPSPRSC